MNKCDHLPLKKNSSIQERNAKYFEGENLNCFISDTHPLFPLTSGVHLNNILILCLSNAHEPLHSN